ncbi:MAG: HAD-superfamily hydrolase, subfamily variant 3 [Chloroflexi bacterium]|nr:HAD-superfamily hydrolase, subfamily variant 3 [Chloroflexota bacterium]
MRYSAILFDAGDTLFRVPKPAPIFHKLLTRHGCQIDVLDVERIANDARRMVDEQLPRAVADDLTVDGAMAARRRDLYVDSIITLTEVADREATRRAFFDLFVGSELFTLYEDVSETLARLRASGYRMGLVSNWEPRLPALCAAHHIWEYFDFAVISEVEGFNKPHPALFQRALALAGLPAERVLHVGDKPREDIEGASSAGIGAVLLDRVGSASMERWPRISSLHQIDGFLS